MSLVYNGTTITQPIYNGTSLGKVNVALTGENLKEAKRSAISTYTKAQVDGWVGITNDTWGSITNASSFTAGEYIYLTFRVSDTGKLARFLMRFKSYSGTTITVDNIGWGYVGSVLGTITVWEYQPSWHTVWTGNAQCGQFTKRGGSSQTIYPITDNNLVVGKTCRITGYQGTTSYPFTSATVPFTTGYSAQAITITDLSVEEISGNKRFRVTGSPSSTATGTYSYIYITKIEQYY